MKTGGLNTVIQDIGNNGKMRYVFFALYTSSCEMILICGMPRALLAISIKQVATRSQMSASYTLIHLEILAVHSKIWHDVFDSVTVVNTEINIC
jgi:hypothetical protein